VEIHVYARRGFVGVLTGRGIPLYLIGIVVAATAAAAAAAAKAAAELQLLKKQL